MTSRHTILPCDRLQFARAGRPGFWHEQRGTAGADGWGKNKTVNPTWCNRQVGFTALQQKNGKRTKFEITGCAL